MPKKYDAAFVLSVKDVALITNTSEQTARESIKKWKQQLGLDEKAYFTIYHLSLVLIVPLEKLIESLKYLYA